MAGEFAIQGEIDFVAGTVLYTGSDNTLLTKILTLNFNNPAAYTLRLERYDSRSATTIVLYDLSLAAGDTVTDSLVYALNYGDTLTVYTSIAGTSYYAYGLDYGDN